MLHLPVVWRRVRQVETRGGYKVAVVLPWEQLNWGGRGCDGKERGRETDSPHLVSALSRGLPSHHSTAGLLYTAGAYLPIIPLSVPRSCLSMPRRLSRTPPIIAGRQVSRRSGSRRPGPITKETAIGQKTPSRWSGSAHGTHWTAGGKRGRIPEPEHDRKRRGCAKHHNHAILRDSRFVYIMAFWRRGAGGGP